MAGFSNTIENAILDLVLSATAYAHGAANRFSLHTGDPGETGANEVVGGSYARVAGTWAAASAGAASPAAPVDFPGMPAVTVTHFGVWTAAGVFVGGGATTNRALLAGDTYRLNTTTTFTLD